MSRRIGLLFSLLILPLAACPSDDTAETTTFGDEVGDSGTTNSETTTDGEGSGSAGTTDTTDTADTTDTTDATDTTDTTEEGVDPECGNGVVEEGEECDDGGESETCDADCTAASCGDGTLNMAAGEACDDGNDVEDDGCNTMCMAANCGDGVVDEGEECDDGNRDQTDECAACSVASCGDGYTQAGVEECDDANDVDTDECLNACTAAACGDAVVQEGVEECDDGNDVDTDSCPTTCTDAICGDGFVQAEFEECDDGNDLPGDGCTPMCMLECGDDCWGEEGCMTDEGKCVRFTCTPGNGSETACDTCFGWESITYQQWLQEGYCEDVSSKYRDVNAYATQCGSAPQCCSDPNDCGGSDNAWHFFDGTDNRFVGPCLGCMSEDNCTYWDGVSNSDYTRITACERPMP